METKNRLLVCLIVAVALCFAHGQSRAPTQHPAAPSKVNMGVVSIKKIFQDSKRHASYMEKALAERQQIEAELDKLNKEIEAEKAGLKTLKPDSNDYWASTKQIIEKQSTLQAKQDFHKQHLEMQDQQWTEQFYKEILQQTAKVAGQKGLDLVFETDEPELPAPSANELMLIIRTHKLLYSGGCLDITGAVIEQLDGEQN